MVAYQVVGEMGLFTTNTPAGRMRVTINKRGMVPSDVPAEEIRHHLSVGLIRAVGVPAPVRAPTVPSPQPATTADAPAVEVSYSPPGEPELPEERLAAQAKLPADGSLPHHNAAKAVWVEAAVRSGYAYDAAAAAEKPELVKLLKS